MDVGTFLPAKQNICEVLRPRWNVAVSSDKTKVTNEIISPSNRFHTSKFAPCRVELLLVLPNVVPPNVQKSTDSLVRPPKEQETFQLEWNQGSLHSTAIFCGSKADGTPKSIGDTEPWNVIQRQPCCCGCSTKTGETQRVHTPLSQRTGFRFCYFRRQSLNEALRLRMGKCRLKGTHNYNEKK